MAAYPVNLGSGVGVCGVTVVVNVPFLCFFVFVMLVLWSTFGSCIINMDGLCVVRKMVSSLMRVVFLSPRTLYEMMVNRMSLFIYARDPVRVRAVLLDIDDVDVDVDVDVHVAGCSSLSFSMSPVRGRLLPAVDVGVAVVVIGCVTDNSVLNACA